MSWPRIQMCVAFESLIAVFQGSIDLLSHNDRAPRIDHQRQQSADNIDNATYYEWRFPLARPLEGVSDDEGTARATKIAVCIHRATYSASSVAADVVTHRPRRA